jgi:hypothetical protein
VWSVGLCSYNLLLEDMNTMDIILCGCGDYMDIILAMPSEQ